jgi:hypothetical protein
MPRVPAHLCELAFGMLQGGMRSADVTRAINCNVRTVRRLKTATGRQDGQLIILSVADHVKQHLHRISTSEHYTCGTAVRVTPGTHNPSISAQTVHKKLRQAGPRACMPLVRQVLPRHHRQQRRIWAQIHRRWIRQDWQKVLFTDE